MQLTHGNFLFVVGDLLNGVLICFWLCLKFSWLISSTCKTDMVWMCCLQALLGGCSAGGLSSILHCDKFKAALPGAKVVKCMSDAGFFVDMSFSLSLPPSLSLSLWWLTTNCCTNVEYSLLCYIFGMPFAHKMMGIKTKGTQELWRQVRNLLMMVDFGIYR
jgi:hypothetical protein